MEIKDLRKKAGKETSVLDLCTGSGCIALYLSKHGGKVTATDISSASEMSGQGN